MTAVNRTNANLEVLRRPVRRGPALSGVRLVNVGQKVPHPGQGPAQTSGIGVQR